MTSRRKFLTHSLVGIGAAAAGFYLGKRQIQDPKKLKSTVIKNPSAPSFFNPTVISTWYHGLAANNMAWSIIERNGKAIDACEQGVRVTEADVTGRSVGIGGQPDRDGNVTLDACIMDHNGNAGAVCYLQDILHPISVARKVMDDTPHVMLAGAGAKKFALEIGMKLTSLLTPETENDWKEWLKTSKYKPIINVENHDTIGLLALDQHGDLSGACTTSGLAYKMAGRVGDSPIIGAGLFVDNEVGACTATGLGEAVMKTCATFLVVELMRQGDSPKEACKKAIMRIVKNQHYEDFQIGLIAISKSGETGAYAIHPGFEYALKTNEEDKMVTVESFIQAHENESSI